MTFFKKKKQKQQQKPRNYSQKANQTEVQGGGETTTSH